MWSAVPAGFGALAAVLWVGVLASKNSVRRMNSPPDAMWIVAKTFAGVVIGSALGAMMFSSFGFPFSWVGLVSGAALGAAYAIGEHRSSQ